MLKKVLFSLLLLVGFFLFPKNSIAQDKYINADYVIEDFQSNIEVQKDTSFLITETIRAKFLINKHGIIRVVPYIYSANGKTINSDIKILSVSDEKGVSYNYTTSRLNQSLKIQIGDANKYVTGAHSYIIKYQVSKVLLDEKDYFEVYWNVTGHEWDTTIMKASGEVNSPFAKITNAQCFLGIIKSKDTLCEKTSSTDNSVKFVSTVPINPGEDFTIDAALNKDNQLSFPGTVTKTGWFLVDNWGYLLSLAPLAFIVVFWILRGRDKRYLNENVYMQQNETKTKSVSIFDRPHLPMVYYPIQGLTPAEVGTIIDEKVDIQDIIAEIVELGRLGFIKIEKISKKGIFGKEDYSFTKLKTDSENLKDHQQYIFKELFRATVVASSIKTAEKLYKDNPAKLKSIQKDLIAENFVLLSALKDHFYESLETIRTKLYKGLANDNIFDGDPRKVKGKWIGLTVLVYISVSALLIFAYIVPTYNPFPLFMLIATSIPGIIFANAMPRRTAWGYSLLRQITGLKYYLGKGKWREEINEKNLFFEEMLPLAVSLGVVDKLAKDMAVLDVKPPQYFSGATATTFSSDFSTFNRIAVANVLSAPAPTYNTSGSWSGHSSWSGGGGFSGGGSSGGGFGGGGGGSW